MEILTDRQGATRSTTEIGDVLRDQVIDLLEAEGHKVSREIRIGTKKVDILLEKRDETGSGANREFFIYLANLSRRSRSSNTMTILAKFDPL